MIFRKPVTGICMVVLLGACGGGEPPPRVAPQPPTDITITMGRRTWRQISDWLDQSAGLSYRQTEEVCQIRVMAKRIAELAK